MRSLVAALAAALAGGALACTSEPAPKTPAPAPGPAPLTELVASSSVAVVYRVSSAAPSTHYLEVEAAYPTLGRSSLTLMMPVWTPGSYLVREFARHVDRIEAYDAEGRPRPVKKIRKNRWQVEVGPSPQLRLRYRVYAQEASVRTNYLDADHLVLNGAATFIADVARLDAPHEVELDLGARFADFATALARTEGGRRLAPDYDTLVDAPIVAGALRRFPFEVRSVPHELVMLGGAQTWPDARAAKDVKVLSETLADFWGQVPFSRYVFLNVIGLAGGGLEHKASTLMMTGHHSPRTEDGYRRWLGLVAHEHFHTWNGKRLRPEALGPFDYEREVYTRGLWVVEGLTSYYDDLLVMRAGLVPEAWYLKQLGKQIARLEKTPGRLVQPLASSSYDAWIEFYRHDESSENTTISYYNKGAVVGFVLDMAIRRHSEGRRSLDDVMRAAYAAHAGEAGFTDAEWFDALEAAGGPKVRALADRLVNTTEEIDYRRALETVGLRFADGPELPGPEADPEVRREALRKTTWLGVETEKRGGRLMVSRVIAGSPAAQDGLQVGDELVAFDGLRITGGLAGRVQYHLPGDEIAVLVARHERMTTVKVRLQSKPKADYTLKVDPNADRRARNTRAAWLSQ